MAQTNAHSKSTSKILPFLSRSFSFALGLVKKLHSCFMKRGHRPLVRWIKRTTNQKIVEASRLVEATPPALEESLRDAELLMRYAAQYGIPVENSVVSGIADAKDQFRAGQLTGPQEAGFYRHFILLSRAVAPVTVESLESCTKKYDLREFLFWRYKGTYADRAIRRHRVWGIIGLVILVVVQTYWVIGSYLTANIPMLSDSESDRKQAIVQQALWSAGTPGSAAQGKDANQAAAPGPSPNGTSVTAVESEAVKKEEQGITKAREKTYEWLLDLWNTPQIAFVLWLDVHTKSPLKQEAAPSWRNGILAKYLLNILQTYVLPPLYGWIGAVAYVLRRLISEINARTYREDTNILYNLRIFLGTLAGLAIGWFFPPSNAGGEHVLQALSLLALAFLAGYSVELLFSAMDKLLDAFSVKQPGSE
jgi:hypothetical protein